MSTALGRVKSLLLEKKRQRYRKLVAFYREHFAGRKYYRLNRLLHHLSNAGMGLYNSSNFRISGEEYAVRSLFRSDESLTLVDVGAHFGEYTRLLTQHYPKARVISLEPHPDTFKELRSRTRGLNVTPINVAVSDIAGTAEFHDFKDRSSASLASQLYPTYEGKPYGSPNASLHSEIFEKFYSEEHQTWRVPVTTIDQLMNDLGITQIDLLKIDAEGNERQVLLGARNAIASGRIRAFQIEFCVLHVYSRVFARDLIDLLPGYKFYRMLPDAWIDLGPYDPRNYEFFAMSNLVAVRKDFLRARPEIRVIHV